MGNEALGQVINGAGLMDPEEFAKQIGDRVSEETVQGWVRRGYIPTVQVGRRRLVNLIALHRELNQQKFQLQGEF